MWHATIQSRSLIGALARWKLGWALARSGDPANARAAYDEFLNPWKDADTDIPILRMVRKEYANLNEMSIPRYSSSTNDFSLARAASHCVETDSRYRVASSKGLGSSSNRRSLPFG